MSRTLPMASYHLGRGIRVAEAVGALPGVEPSEVGRHEALVRLEEGWVHLHSFGSAVFVGLSRERTRPLLEALQAAVDDRDPRGVSDEYLLEVREGESEHVEFDRVVVGTLDPVRLKLVSLVLAQSTTLEHFELLVDERLDRLASVTEAMARGGSVTLGFRDMLRLIGEGLSTRREIVSRLSILDPPEAAWEDPALDEMYHGLRVNFELQTRFRALEYKLRLIHESVEVLVDLTNTRRFTVLELTIILLIALEIVVAILGAFH